MDVSKWHVFTKIAEVLNVTAAAEQLDMSQSGVSYIIKCLEQETGFPLFIRHPQGVALTASARELLPVIHNFLNEKEKIDQTIAQINGMTRGTIRIACYQSISITWLPEILRQFLHDFPHIRIDIWEGGDDDVENALCNNEVDLAFTSLRERPNCEWIPLATDYLQAIFPEGHRLASKECIPLVVFKDEPFITSPDFYEHDVNYFLKKHGVQPANILCHSTEALSIMAMVRQGLGSSLLFTRIIEAGGPHKLVVKPIEPPIFRQLGIVIASRERASPATKIFIEYAEDVLSVLDLV
ncbi:LysR family transcriptional regulator [Desulfovibrio sp. OttesenSCG-928-G15]|nr:LysR family transcriptional regulator [Desulfovibrio sp. OttesenSCG-928-G15]